MVDDGIVDNIGCKVTVVYDPANTEELTIEHEGYESFKVKELVIGERTGSRPKLPEHLQSKPAESSRLLTAATKKNKQRQEEGSVRGTGLLTTPPI